MRPQDFTAISALMKELPGADEAAVAAVRRREGELTKPAGSLGRLEAVTEWLAAWQGIPPRVEAPAVVVFAANHGVAANGVSAYPVSVTAQMVANFEAGGAAINQLAALHDMALRVVPLRLEAPTADISRAAAMSEEECCEAFGIGMESVPEGADLLCLGEMGIGNTTAASALCAGLLDVGGEGDGFEARKREALSRDRMPHEEWVGPGTGVVEEALARKREAVARAVGLHGAAARESALEGLRRLGGREFAALAGAIVAARVGRIPVLLDGFAVCAAAAVLARMRGDALAHCMAAHRSAEPAHGRLLERLGMAPLLDLGMRLGEGSGAALAVGLARAAARLHAGMATFAEAQVAGKVEA